MRNINEVVVHCSATRPEWMSGSSLSAKIKEIRRWHLARKFNDIGYHSIIDRDGKTAQGRDDDIKGAHVIGHNDNTLGICLIGGHGGAATDKFEGHFTPAQDIALRKLLKELEARHPIKKVSGHNEYANKGCPCFDVGDWLKQAPPEQSAPPSSGFFVAILEAILAVFKR